MNIGLVLSGGGLRGVAQIGAIKALEEFGVYATHISGSSAGAIVGSLYAYGYGWQEMLQFFKKIQIFDIKKYAFGKPGFIDTEKFYSEFKTYIKEDDFSILKKSLSVTATNILNGKLKAFNSGELIKPVLASAAFPGVFSPVKIGSSYYIDGGALDNFPVKYLKSKCDIIIGVYVNGYKDITINDLKHSYSVFERAFKLKSAKEDYAKFKDCDFVVMPTQLDVYGTFEKTHIDTMFKIGYEATKKALEDNPTVQLKIKSNTIKS